MAMIDYYNGVATEQPVVKQPVGWVERLTDWIVIAKELLHGRMNWRDVSKTYKTHKENAVWQWTDPLPGIMYVMLSPILYIKRH